MSEKKPVVDPYESLWKCITRRCRPEISVHEEREPEGTYVNGFRVKRSVWTIERRTYTVVATKIRSMTMSLAADVDETNRRIEIVSGKKTVLKVTQEGLATRRDFGSGEVSLGTTKTPAGPWALRKGNIPPSLRRAF